MLHLALILLQGLNSDSADHIQFLPLERISGELEQSKGPPGPLGP